MNFIINVFSAGHESMTVIGLQNEWDKDTLTLKLDKERACLNFHSQRIVVINITTKTANIIIPKI